MTYINIFLLYVMSLFSSIADAPVRTDPLPDGGGAYEHEAPTSCLTDDERAEIVTALMRSRQELIREGKLSAHPNKRSVMSFGFPLKAAAHMPPNFSNFYGISNYLDQNASTNAWADYNCGWRTYDGHNGTDYYSWPFEWYMVEQDLVEVVAVAPGTIIYKQSDQVDDHCDWMQPGGWNAIYVEHADGSIAWYGHMKKNSLTSKPVGAQVAADEFLGIVASSGRSSGPHLHLEIYEDLPYQRSNLIDPYQGSCNSLNSNSWWQQQDAYNVPTLNAVVTHDAPPVFGCPGVNENPNFADSFFVGDPVYTAFYYRDQYQGSFSQHAIYDSDGALFTQWNHNSPNTYNSSYWYWIRNLPPAGPFGTWRVESTYQGQTVVKEFEYHAVACQDPGQNTWTGPAQGDWDVDAYWSRGFAPLYCDHVVIPAGVQVDVPAGYQAICHQLEVQDGAELIVPSTAELTVITEQGF